MQELENQSGPYSEPPAMPFMLKYQGVANIITAAAAACVFMFDDKMVIAAGGIVLAVLLLWSLGELFLRKSIAFYYRRSLRWAHMVLVIGVVLAVLKLTGYYTNLLGTDPTPEDPFEKALRNVK